MKALVGAFNQEKALVGAFSVIVLPVVEHCTALTSMWTGISSFCRVAGVSLRNPISRLYSTMYSSSGHTIFVSFLRSEI